MGQCIGAPPAPVPTPRAATSYAITTHAPTSHAPTPGTITTHAPTTHAPTPGAITTHAVTTSHHHVVVYPDHPERKQSPRYRHTHASLVARLPCFICGKAAPAHVTLAPLETHHYFCEHAAMSGIDWIKFGEQAATLYNPQTGTHIGSQFDWAKVQKDPEIFVDSEHNMLVLCVEHHRSSHRGIHHVPHPDWLLQLAPVTGYVPLPLPAKK